MTGEGSLSTRFIQRSIGDPPSDKETYVKLYHSIGPNPRIVRMFMAEKGIELPLVEIDLMAGENRQGAYLEKNPFGQLPALELDDGTVLTEVTAICEYLDEAFPGGSLIGSTAEERAATRMWTRRVDLYVAEPMLNGFRYAEGLALFEPRMRVIPHAADDLKQLAGEKLVLLDQQMAGRDYLCGDRFSFADLFLFCMLDFAGTVGQPLDASLTQLSAWKERVGQRPSAAATS